MNMSVPLVTVYIPTKDRPDLLRRAVTSVLKQSYPRIELIIVDDGSLDVNKELIAAVCSISSSIRLVSYSESKGACHARNQAIELAAGEFITGLDDDDEFLPQRISDFVARWSAYSSISALCTGYEYILPSGKAILSGGRLIQIGQDDIKHKNDVGNQVFTKTAYLKQIGGFDPKLVACQDYDVWIRLICQFGPMVRLPKITYVVHQEHEYPRISQFSRRIEGHCALIDKHSTALSYQQLASQRFFCALYGGETNILKLIRMAGRRHIITLMKMLMVRLLTKYRL
jgi:glycosyltransferase involved in cell wall biosynthesis